MKEKKRWKNWICVLLVATLLVEAWGFAKGDEAQASQSRTISTGNLEREAISESSGLAQLQIPQKMEIVIDPWEMDEKEQIYSKEYTIQNMGETPGALTLDFACKVREDTGLSFQEDPDGIHSSDEKLIYMKVLFGTGEEAVFTQEGVKYQAELQPGETLSLRFTGEVNENADDPWKNGDIEIEGTYSWEQKKVRSEETLKEVSENEKETFNKDALPAETGEDGGMPPIQPDEIGQDGNDEELVLPGEMEQETVDESSLSGNGLKE